MTFHSVAMSTVASAKKTIAMYLLAFVVAVMLMMVQGYSGFQIFRFEDGGKPASTTTQPETPIQSDKPVLPLREIDDLKATFLMSQRSIESLVSQVKNLTSQIESFTASTASERAESRALIAELLKSNKIAEKRNAELYAALNASARWNSTTDTNLGVQYTTGPASTSSIWTSAIKPQDTYVHIPEAAGFAPNEKGAASAFERPVKQNPKEN